MWPSPNTRNPATGVRNSKCWYSTDRTQPNTKADPESGCRVRFGSASSPLFKNLRPLWVRQGFALSPLWVRQGFALRPLLGGPLCALMREADPALLLPPTSSASCIFQIPCPASSFCSSDRKHKHVQDSQAISWRTSTKSPEFRFIFGKELLF